MGGLNRHISKQNIQQSKTITENLNEKPPQIKIMISTYQHTSAY